MKDTTSDQWKGIFDSKEIEIKLSKIPSHYFHSADKMAPDKAMQIITIAAHV